MLIPFEFFNLFYRDENKYQTYNSNYKSILVKIQHSSTDVEQDTPVNSL